MDFDHQSAFFYLRVAACLFWGAAALVLLPSAYRYFRPRGDVVLEYRTALFFTALLLFGTVARWLVAPDEQGVFLALTAITGALGVYVLILGVQGLRK